MKLMRDSVLVSCWWICYKPYRVMCLKYMCKVAGFGQFWAEL